MTMTATKTVTKHVAQQARRRRWRAAARLAAGAALALGAAGPVLAQDGGLAVSAGVRAWYTHWTTFSYYDGGGPVNLALTQTSGPATWVFLPTASVRWGNWFGAASIFPSTSFDFTDGSSTKRSELDVNVGYAVLPGLNLTLGYKKVSQRGDFRYEPKGPVAGISANAPLAGAFSLYGSLGLGRLKTPARNGDPKVVDFKADYRLTEVGLAYALPGSAFVQRWTITAGHRIQVMRSKDAFTSATGQAQDGIDTAQGFTLGVLATF
ncbi:MAG: hypothetical protein JNL85_02700 [Rubrivivax sp.]|nr:hypothetical protein [Rubrivivax sp.]